MKTSIKKVVLALVLAYFVLAMLWGCSSQNYACQTYAGHYSNLYAKYKVRK